MKKKFAVLFLVVTLCVGGLIGICGCCSLIGHAWDGGTVLAEPGCSESGEMLYTCSECGETKTEKIIPKGHTYGEWVFEEGHLCTDGGNATRTCSTCNSTETKKFSATAHSYGGWETVTPTSCTTDGVEKRTCSICNHTETNTFKAKGHSFDDWTVTLKPTCTTDGTAKRTCSNCTHTEIQTVPPQHTFGSWQTISEATCTAEGEKSRTCSACGLLERQIINALGHEFSSHTHSVDATCTENGNIEYWTCSNCQKNFKDAEGTVVATNVTIYATGHELTHYTAKEPTCTENGNIDYWGCSQCNKNFSDNSGKTEIAGEVIKPATGHTDVNHDGTCDECNEFTGEVTLINSVDDLKLIINDLGGTYSLQKDLVLEEHWAGIGTMQYPFTGEFYGNGHTISSLMYYQATNPGGLFIDNQGLIDGLTLSNINIMVWYVDFVAKGTITFGGIAAYNHGTIQNCKITGSNRMDSSNMWALGPGKTTEHTFISGGITAQNYGKIDGCSVEGTMSNVVEAQCQTKRSGLLVLESDWAQVTSHSIFGNVAGINKGTITNTTVTCTNNAQLKCISTAPNAGKSTTIINSKMGSFVGTNEGTIKDCSAKAICISQNKSDNYNANSTVLTATINVSNVSRYSGLLATNSGTVENLSLLI